MAHRFISTRPDAPRGYEVLNPAKSDLLRGTVVLLVTDEGEARRLLDGLWSRFCGVLIVPSETTAVEACGPLAWRLQAPLDLVPALHPCLEGFAAAIGVGKAASDQKLVWQKEVARLDLVHSAVREHYNLVTERLRENVAQVSSLNHSLQEQLERVQKTESALQRSERDLAITLDAIGDAVVATDLNITIRHMNPAAEELCGWRKDEAIGHPIEDVFPLLDSQDRAIHPELAERVLTLGRTIGLPKDTRLHDRQGRERRVFHSAAPIQDERGHPTGIVYVFRDMTEQLRLEEDLRQRQRMDALGQLAGGVAHDFNNLLLGIQGFAELLETRLGDDDQSLHFLRSIQTASERAAGLTRQLLTFARKQVSRMQKVDLHRLIREVVELAAHTFDRRISLRTRLLAYPSTIVGEPALLQSVLLNLLINARDAMPDGGVLKVTTATHGHLQLPPSLASMPAADYLSVEVEDSGIGIAPEHLDRIFEPFFTTKSTGKGTGLGLSTLYGTMEDHKGKVTVSSQLGGGTRFTLYFPLAEALSEPLPTEPGTPTRGHVLVVDDEDFVRNFLRMSLESAGYAVTLAENGKAALDLVAAGPSAYDVVLMDLNMPVMNGRDALAAMRPLAPDLPVVVASGYITEADLDELRNLGAQAILAKPFKVQELCERISEQIPR